jgi:MSHA biogenesis protein MshP
MSILHKHLPSRMQNGFAIVSAIFLLVILSALGAFMLTFSNTQQLTSAQDIQGSRAYWAAKGGVQWAAAVLQAPATACPAAVTNFTLDGFAVAVTCTANTYTEGTDTRVIYWVHSVATSGGSVGSIGYTERAIDAFMEF